MLISLMRHGQTAFNTQKRFQGHLDTELTSEGVAQVAQVAHSLVDDLGLRDPQKKKVHYFCSDLKRARQSLEIFLEIFANGGTFVQSSLLREFDVGKFAGRTFQELEQESPKETQGYLDAYDIDPDQTPYPGGESAADVCARLRKFWHLHLACFAEIGRCSSVKTEHIRAYESEPWVLIVGHGGSLSIFDKLLTGRSEPTWFGNAELQTYRLSSK